MKRPSKKEIQETIAKLKDKPTGSFKPLDAHNQGKPEAKKSSQRIRKQGV